MSSSKNTIIELENMPKDEEAIEKIKVLQDKINLESSLLEQLQKEIRVIGGCYCNFPVGSKYVSAFERCPTCREYPTSLRDGVRGYLKHHDNFSAPSWHKKEYDPVGGHWWVQENKHKRTTKSCLESGRAFMRKRKAEREVDRDIKYLNKKCPAQTSK